MFTLFFGIEKPRGVATWEDENNNNHVSNDNNGKHLVWKDGASERR